MKRIEKIVAEYSAVDSRTFVAEVSNAYFRYVATKYDATHPDVFYDCADAWKKLLKVLADDGIDFEHFTVVDLGSGTGMVGLQFHHASIRIAEYVGAESSPEMHSIAIRNLSSVTWPVRLVDNNFNNRGEISRLLNEVQGPKIVTLNSVLHHIVWWEEFLTELVEALSAGDLVIVSHEPNLAFWNDQQHVEMFKQVRQRLANTSRWSRYLEPRRYLQRIRQYLHLSFLFRGLTTVEKANLSLKSQGVIIKDLDPVTIPRIVNYGEPGVWMQDTASDADLGEGFASYERLCSEFFYKWRVICCFTYLPLGVSWKLLSPIERSLSQRLTAEGPMAGAVYCVALQK